MSEEMEAPMPVPPDTKPVTVAPTPGQIQEQYFARSEKDEGYEAPITKEEPTHKGCDVVYQNHLGKVISIQQNDLDLSQAAALNDWLIDWLIEDILQAPSTMSGDLRA